MPYDTWNGDVTASQSGSVNTSLDGLSVAEGCPAGNMNAMGRMLMANMRNLHNSVPAAGMPLTGGTFTGDILRNGRGGYLHHASATYLSGRVYVTALGAADPTSAVGDIWIELSA